MGGSFPVTRGGPLCEVEVLVDSVRLRRHQALGAADGSQMGSPLPGSELSVLPTVSIVDDHEAFNGATRETMRERSREGASANRGAFDTRKGSAAVGRAAIRWTTGIAHQASSSHIDGGRYIDSTDRQLSI